ncbi:MGMT family protein [Deinococcus deserti]|uniref:Putative Methylated-DNA--[protein]-cysteine S-methyltransferase (6-O-methylguanine-DNA methyltransferase) (O-6-methylguanine-DNA-alkyltransferase) n=1 Tax=Deinococcus deserti (strain DSM 17065 / CIP 109153 / LMG 22923 / VCD115) TaxID=546414 RepID=C1CZR0_DEIDV|nr:MGMT family protein [Deinococcus deserti]ACO47308.1 putative Methylated-DNA--[protein]-cysteine S-methyltransferase (6-O-methylguanine-DNA methyltransferase) (O-6-methylguanine-DNA-alkyltransferase) [Deinococcus deserti VCD115]
MTSTPEPSFRERVLALVTRIPEGRVMTYGQLALLAGQPGAARQAGYVMNTLMGGSDLPWQRVINAQGRVSTHKLGFGDMQEKLLEAEGVTFDDAGRCDLGRLQWWPPEAAPGSPEPLL